MLVLDTGIISHWQAAGAVGERVQQRCQAYGRPLALAIVTLMEQFRGRLAACHRANDPNDFMAEALRLH